MVDSVPSNAHIAALKVDIELAILTFSISLLERSAYTA